MGGRLPGRTPQFFYFDDLAGRRLRPETLTREVAMEQAKALARAERDKGGYLGGRIGLSDAC